MLKKRDKPNRVFKMQRFDWPILDSLKLRMSRYLSGSLSYYCPRHPFGPNRLRLPQNKSDRLWMPFLFGKKDSCTSKTTSPNISLCCWGHERSLWQYDEQRRSLLTTSLVVHCKAWLADLRSRPSRLIYTLLRLVAWASPPRSLFLYKINGWFLLYCILHPIYFGLYISLLRRISFCGTKRRSNPPAKERH